MSSQSQQKRLQSLSPGYNDPLIKKAPTTDLLTSPRGVLNSKHLNHREGLSEFLIIRI
jgi:hypothetical protein